MGSLLEFRHPNPAPPRAFFGLARRLVEQDAPRGTRAVLQIDGLAVFCVVAEVPVVGDVVHGDVTAIVEKVRITRAGHVYIEARRATPRVDGTQAGGVETDPAENGSPRVDAVLREMRRRRQFRKPVACGPRPTE